MHLLSLVGSQSLIYLDRQSGIYISDSPFRTTSCRMYVSVRMQGHVLGFSLVDLNTVTPASYLSHLPDN